MMILFRLLVILVLSVGIFGTAGYFAYELIWKPEHLDEVDRQQTAAQPIPAAVPDYTLPAYEKAVQTQRAGDLGGAKAAFEDFLRNYPDAPKVKDARRALGNINAQSFFSPTESPDKTVYQVASRDSLARISGKFKSSPELIFRVNNLESINLQVGQTLYIPRPQISIVVDRKKKTVTLMNNSQFTAGT